MGVWGSVVRGGCLTALEPFLPRAACGRGAGARRQASAVEATAKLPVPVMCFNLLFEYSESRSGPTSSVFDPGPLG